MNNRFKVQFIGFEPVHYPIEVIDNNGVPFTKPKQFNLRVCDAQELIEKLREAIYQAQQKEILNREELNDKSS